MTRNIKSCFTRCLTKGLCAALALGLLAGCGARRTQDPRTLRIGVAVYLQSDTFISTLVQELERQAQEREQTQNIKINLNVVDGHGSQITQTEQIDRFIALDYDVLCVNIVDRTSAALLIDKAKEADIPLIFFNREPVAEDIQRWDSVYYVGARAEQSGLLQGQILLDCWLDDRERADKNGDGVLQYVMLEGEPGHQDAMLRTEYAVRTLLDAGVEVEKLASNTANWDRAQASARVTQWVEEFGDSIEAVISNNDDMALGAIDVFRQMGMDGETMPLVVGVDATAPALEAVRTGELKGTVRNDAQGIAQSMLDLSLTLADGQDPAETMELTDGQYIWRPYEQVTLKDLEPQEAAA